MLYFHMYQDMCHILSLVNSPNNVLQLYNLFHGQYHGCFHVGLCRVCVTSYLLQSYYIVLTRQKPTDIKVSIHYSTMHRLTIRR